MPRVEWERAGFLEAATIRSSGRSAHQDRHYDGRFEGDVQPCVALGLGLKRSGHEVTVATWAAFRKLVEGNGLSFHPVAGPDHGRLMAGLVEAGSNPIEFAGRFRGFLRPHIRRGFYDCLAACRNADAIVYTPLGFAGYMVAELLRLPAVGSVVEPLFVRSGRYPSAMLGPPPDGSTLIRTPRLGRLFNHLTHLVVEQLYWRTSQPLVDAPPPHQLAFSSNSANRADLLMALDCHASSFRLAARLSAAALALS